jgi:hypothetical protein
MNYDTVIDGLSTPGQPAWVALLSLALDVALGVGFALPLLRRGQPKDGHWVVRVMTGIAAGYYAAGGTVSLILLTVPSTTAERVYREFPDSTVTAVTTFVTVAAVSGCRAALSAVLTACRGDGQ